MKWIRCALISVLVCVAAGCATAPIIGPCSYATAQSNKKAAIRRAAMRSPTLNAEQKAKVFQATAWSSDAGEIAMGVQINITELVYGGYTGMEVLKQVGGCAGDLGIYGLVGLGIKALADKIDDDDDSPSIRTDISGDDNEVQINQGTGNVNKKKRDSDNEGD